MWPTKSPTATNDAAETRASHIAEARTPNRRQSHPDPCIHVSNADKSKMLAIPWPLILATAGSENYLQTIHNPYQAFRFRLCRLFGPRSQCGHRSKCSFIHSRQEAPPRRRGWRIRSPSVVCTFGFPQPLVPTTFNACQCNNRIHTPVTRQGAHSTSLGSGAS